MKTRAIGSFDSFPEGLFSRKRKRFILQTTIICQVTFDLESIGNISSAYVFPLETIHVLQAVNSYDLEALSKLSVGGVVDLETILDITRQNVFDLEVIQTITTTDSFDLESTGSAAVTGVSVLVLETLLNLSLPFTADLESLTNEIKSVNADIEVLGGVHGNQSLALDNSANESINYGIPLEIISRPPAKDAVFSIESLVDTNIAITFDIELISNCTALAIFDIESTGRSVAVGAIDWPEVFPVESDWPEVFPVEIKCSIEFVAPNFNSDWNP